MRNEIKEVRAENTRLKTANKKHLPYNTAEELENVLAGIILLESDIEIKQTIIDNIKAHAILARENKRAGRGV